MLELGSCHSWHFFGILLENSDQGFIINKYFCPSVGRQEGVAVKSAHGQLCPWLCGDPNFSHSPWHTHL